MSKSLLVLLIAFIMMAFYYSFFQGYDLERYLAEVDNSKISVEIRGEVKNPGVYEVNRRTSLKELIQLCEGFTLDANQESVNLAMILKDDDLIIIPKITKQEKISINFGTLEQLDSIKGIGIKTAQAIIDYRNANGLFQKLEDLKNVKGIKDKTFEKIKDQIQL